MKGIIDRYSEFVVNHPFIVLVIAMVLTGISVWASGFVTTTDMNYKDMLPEDREEIKALYFVSDEFVSSSDSVSIVVEIDPHYQNSTEPRDVRTIETLEYMELIENKILFEDNIISVYGLPDALKNMNNGTLPKSRHEILSLTGSLEPSGGGAIIYSSQVNSFQGIISEDYSLAVIKVSVSDMPPEKQAELVEELKNIISETEKPAGLKVGLTGDVVISEQVSNLIGPTMSQTSSISMIGILILLTLLFMSLRKGLTSLLAIVFGVVWVYGLMGILGMSLTSATSGCLSMIMGVGIDFGIQIVNRFNQELKVLKIEKAMKKTLNAVILPMSITTLAALIGFRAMSLGELTLLADLGNIMALGIMTCFLAAIMVIPPILIYSEKIRAKIIG
jgi:predicted RND superfamily exporter protein